MKERLIYLDFLKGFAIFLVVLGHIYFYMLHEYNSATVRIISSLHMPIFFFVAGYLLNKTGKIKSKFQRLIIPFLFWGGIYIIYKKSYIERLFFEEFHAGYWFTLCLFYFYIIMHCYYKVETYYKAQKYMRILIIAVFIILLFLFCTINEKINNLMCVPFIKRYFIYFLAGNMISQKLIITNVLFSKCALIIYLLFYVLMFPYYLNYHFIAMNFISQTLISFSILFFTFSFAKIISEKNTENFCIRILSNIGKYSLSIYLLHYFFLSTTNLTSFVNRIEESGMHIFLKFILYSFIALVIIGLCIVCDLIIKRIPILKRTIG